MSHVHAFTADRHLAYIVFALQASVPTCNTCASSSIMYCPLVMSAAGLPGSRSPSMMSHPRSVEYLCEASIEAQLTMTC